jgi:hypothetical protein
MKNIELIVSDPVKVRYADLRLALQDMIIEATGMDKILNSENVYGEKKCEIH